jgi:hypothetical protein
VVVGLIAVFAATVLVAPPSSRWESIADLDSTPAACRAGGETRFAPPSFEQILEYSDLVIRGQVLGCRQIDLGKQAGHTPGIEYEVRVLEVLKGGVPQRTLNVVQGSYTSRFHYMAIGFGYYLFLIERMYPDVPGNYHLNSPGVFVVAGDSVLLNGDNPYPANVNSIPKAMFLKDLAAAIGRASD